MSPARTRTAVAHAQFADHAAGRVLHFLDIGIDDQRCRTRPPRRKVPRRDPAAKADNDKKSDRTDRQYMTADRAARGLSLWCS